MRSGLDSSKEGGVMDNMNLWNKLCAPPVWAKKKISGGRLNGKTDINPQWRMRAMTETFGPCGSGWKYTIDKLWAEPGADGQVMAFSQVSVCWRDGEEWAGPIPGIGGSMLVEKEKNGLHTSDEAYKMATTDALSVAFKALGVGADIYQGDEWQSKYKNKAPSPKVKPKTPTLDDYNRVIADAKKRKGQDFTPYESIEEIPPVVRDWAFNTIAA